MENNLKNAMYVYIYTITSLYTQTTLSQLTSLKYICYEI